MLEEKLRVSLGTRINGIVSPSTAHPKPIGPEVPCIAILFSGGVDCTVLARLVDQILPPEQAVDLLNVAFENAQALRAANTSVRHTSSTKHSNVKKLSSTIDEIGGSPLGSEQHQEINLSSSRVHSAAYELCPDRVTARASLRELRAACPRREWRLVEERPRVHLFDAATYSD